MTERTYDQREDLYAARADGSACAACRASPTGWCGPCLNASSLWKPNDEERRVETLDQRLRNAHAREAQIHVRLEELERALVEERTKTARVVDQTLEACARIADQVATDIRVGRPLAKHIAAYGASHLGAHEVGRRIRAQRKAVRS